MKMLKYFLVSVSILISGFLFQSCLDDNDYPLDKFAISVVTINPLEEDNYYLRTDDGETLYPVTNYRMKVNKRQRAIANFTVVGDGNSLYDYMIQVNRIDTFLTKSISPNLHEENDSFYGKDPVNIARDKNNKDLIWIGDGFLNLYFETYWGEIQRVNHFVNLIQTDPENDPYALEFRHNAYNDPKEVYGYSIVAFDLSDLPDTEGEMVKLTIKVHSYEGSKTFSIDYKSDEDFNNAPDRIPSFSLRNQEYSK